jgi:hypothetical protein
MYYQTNGPFPVSLTTPDSLLTGNVDFGKIWDRADTMMIRGTYVMVSIQEECILTWAIR